MSFLAWFITCLTIGAALGVIDAIQLLMSTKHHAD
jgi:hypothetical protein